MLPLCFIGGPATVRALGEKSDYDFALGHIAAMDMQQDGKMGYNTYFSEQSKRGRMVILDNAAYERGGVAMPMAELLPLLPHVNPTIVIAPDYYRDPERTFSETKEFVQTLREERGAEDPKVMGVAHGSTVPEVIDSVKRLKGICDYIAVSKLLYDDSFNWFPPKSGQRLALSRNALCTRLEQEIPGCRDKPWFYLLGMSEPNELAWHKGRSWLIGNDSTSALVHGIHGVEIPEYPEPLGNARVLEKLDFLYVPTADQLALTQVNVERLKQRQRAC